MADQTPPAKQVFFDVTSQVRAAAGTRCRKRHVCVRGRPEEGLKSWFVARGLSNAEIGRELYISEKR